MSDAKAVGWLPTRTDRARILHDAARHLASKAVEERPQDVLWKRGRP